MGKGDLMVPMDSFAKEKVGPGMKDKAKGEKRSDCVLGLIA